MWDVGGVAVGRPLFRTSTLGPPPRGEHGASLVASPRVSPAVSARFTQNHAQERLPRADVHFLLRRIQARQYGPLRQGG